VTFGALAAARCGRPLLTVALLWWTRRFVPGALGSGIPQVMLALDDDI
jgi:H+/Cl- antiporter ClcA